MCFVNWERKDVGKEETKRKRLENSDCATMTSSMQVLLAQSYKRNNEENNKHRISPNTKVELNTIM